MREHQVIFSQIDLPGGTPCHRWQAQLFDANAGELGHTPYPQAIAWLTDFRGTLLDCVMLDFVLVPDHCRREGYAIALIAACQKRWPELELTEPISEAGEGLTEALKSWRNA